MRSNHQWGAIGAPGGVATGSQRFLAVIFVTSIAMFLFALFMVFSGEGMFLLHGPILLLSTMLVFMSGISYLVNPSRSAGLFLIGLLYFAFDATLREGLAAGGGDLQSVVKGLFSVCLLIYGIFTGGKHLLVRPVVVLFFLYAAFGLASSYYSSAVILGIGSGIALMAIALMMADYASRGNGEMFRLWRTLYIASVVMGIGSLAMLAIYPLNAQDLAMAGSFRLRGLTGSANSLGPVMAIGLIAGMLVWKKHKDQRELRWLHGVLCAMLAILLLLTNSRTSIVAYLVSVTSVWIVMTFGSMGVLLTAFVAMCVGFMMLYPNLMNSVMTLAAELFARSGGVQELSSLTGRDEIWKACVRLIEGSPWIGYGLGSVRIEIPRTWEDMWGNSAATAHNGFLESMISVGLVGTVPLFLALFYCLYIFVRYFAGRATTAVPQVEPGDDRALAICGMQCLGFLIVHSLAEKSFAGTAAPATMALGLCVATAAYLERVRWNKQPLLVKTRLWAKG